jgi:hypothetical protein
VVDLDNAINGMMGVATVGIIAGTTERIINGRRRPVRRRVVKKKTSTKHRGRISFW